MMLYDHYKRRDKAPFDDLDIVIRSDVLARAADMPCTITHRPLQPLTPGNPGSRRRDAEEEEEAMAGSI